MRASSGSEVRTVTENRCMLYRFCIASVVSNTAVRYVVLLVIVMSSIRTSMLSIVNGSYPTHIHIRSPVECWLCRIGGMWMCMHDVRLCGVLCEMYSVVVVELVMCVAFSNKRCESSNGVMEYATT